MIVEIGLEGCETICKKATKLNNDIIKNNDENRGYILHQDGYLELMADCLDLTETIKAVYERQSFLRERGLIS